MIKILIIWISTLSITSAATAPLRAKDIKNSSTKTIITAKTIKHQEKVYAIVRNNNDQRDLMSQILEEEQGVEVDQKLAESVIYIDQQESRIFFELFDELIKKGGFSFNKQQQRKLQTAVENYKIDILKKETEELKKAGVNYDPNSQHVVYFYKGESTFKVTNSIKGSLAKGDTINIHYKIRIRIPCPPIRPQLDTELGWCFKELLIANDTVALGHGFSNLETIPELIKQSKKKP